VVFDEIFCMTLLVGSPWPLVVLTVTTSFWCPLALKDTHEDMSYARCGISSAITSHDFSDIFPSLRGS
jgi:hypothetical protein